MGDKKLLAPLSTLEWVDRDKLRPNGCLYDGVP